VIEDIFVVQTFERLNPAELSRREILGFFSANKSVKESPRVK